MRDKSDIRSERKPLLFEGDTVDGELLHCSLAHAHICDHGLHLCSLALQHCIQTGAKPETLMEIVTSLTI